MRRWLSPLKVGRRYDEGGVRVVDIGHDDGDVGAGHAFEGQLESAAAVVLRPVLKKFITLRIELMEIVHIRIKSSYLKHFKLLH